ncbi:MAG: UDP-N-acetylmuramoyl-L-alanine--D-glutamate ligase [Flaviflexus sp.]|nr:UDP-N-acetylmuramoyl-L-alanine--D-glutamate ligase [Flaviflexus sp.]
MRTIPGAADLAGARIAIAGMGTTGRAVEQTLRAHTDTTLACFDDRGDYTELTAPAITAFEPDLVIASPGIPATGGLFEGLGEIPVWSEVELAWRLRSVGEDGPAPWLAVTGTNGKTTTVQMLGAMTRGAVVGNVGNPLITAVTDLDAPPQIVALELSSFQLHATHTMAPLAAGCLNIADDHLDWHGSPAAYRADKARIYRFVTGARCYPLSEPEVAAMVHAAEQDARAAQDQHNEPAGRTVPAERLDVARRSGGARSVALSMTAPEPGQIGLDAGAVIDRAFGSGEVLFEAGALDRLGGGGHLLADAMMAGALARSAGVSAEQIADALASFELGRHRAERVPTTDGITWIDDSKATNAHAAEASIMARDRVIWIAGGLAKGARLDGLVAAIASRLKHVIVIGVDPEPVLSAMSAAPGVPVTRITGPSDTVMSKAVAEAKRVAQPGDTVMMAPACASWDQFSSYGERGDQFRDAVME